jgi:hypothetical protein
MCIHLITSHDRGSLSGDCGSPLAMNALEFRDRTTRERAQHGHPCLIKAARHGPMPALSSPFTGDLSGEMEGVDLRLAVWT